MFNSKSDVEISSGPSDGVSDLSFSPAGDILAASSWEGKVSLLVTL